MWWLPSSNFIPSMMFSAMIDPVDSIIINSLILKTLLISKLRIAITGKHRKYRYRKMLSNMRVCVQQNQLLWCSARDIVEVREKFIVAELSLNYIDFWGFSRIWLFPGGAGSTVPSRSSGIFGSTYINHKVLFLFSLSHLFLLFKALLYLLA